MAGCAHAQQAVVGGVLQGPTLVRWNEDGVITSVEERVGAGLPDDALRGDILIPGFVDIHTHGLGGTDDVMTTWTVPEHTQRIHVTAGTTSFLASLIFPSLASKEGQAAMEMAEGLKAHVGRKGAGSVLEGFHAEGPIISDPGALAPGDVAMAVLEFESFIDRLGPSLRIMTIAPSADANTDFARIQSLAARGIVASLGHDKSASHDNILGAMRAAKSRGSLVSARTHITHIFNVTSFHHRDPSLVNFGLCPSLPSLPAYHGLESPTVEVIGDLCHVHALALKALIAARKPEDITFITDALCAPVPGSRSLYCGRPISVSPAGDCVVLDGTTTLAGSCRSLLDCMHSLVTVLGVTLAEASIMLSTAPAARVGLQHVGSIAVGKRADLLLLQPNLTLTHTIVAGKVMFSKGS